jgi:hypothetical protein
MVWAAPLSRFLDSKLMKNIKVILHGKEHITNKLQTKSLEFTHEFLGNFRRKDSLSFDSKPQ